MCIVQIVVPALGFVELSHLCCFSASYFASVWLSSECVELYQVSASESLARIVVIIVVGLGCSWSKGTSLWFVVAAPLFLSVLVSVSTNHVVFTIIGVLQASR